MQVSRRTLLTTGAAAATFGLGSAKNASAQSRVPFGAAVYLPDLVADRRLIEAVLNHCSSVTPVSEMKWEAIRPTPETFDFSGLDPIADFARRNGLAMHGHTHVWYAGNPGWLKDVRTPAAVEQQMRLHMETVIPRYKDIVRTWDVVNEPIPDVPASANARRDGWYEAMGPNAIKRAFDMAHAIDPTAKLVINEYDVEFAVQKSPAKRQAFRNLIRDLLDKGTPLHAIGLQAHLRGGWPIAKDELAAFVSEMRKAGLEIRVTELDVLDHELPGPAIERDRIIERQVRDFLEAASAAGPLNSITTWGLSDRYTWIKWAFPRKDGTGNRPLPLDQDFAPKPMLQAIEDFRRRT